MNCLIEMGRDEKGGNAQMALHFANTIAPQNATIEGSNRDDDKLGPMTRDDISEYVGGRCIIFVFVNMKSILVQLQQHYYMIIYECVHVFPKRERLNNAITTVSTP